MFFIPKRQDLTGKVYGDFTVIEMLYKYKYTGNKTRTYCRCLGIDGKEYIIRRDALTSGATTSIRNAGNKCELVDLTNQQFGSLTVLYPTNKRGANGSVSWHCKCRCGVEIDVLSTNLSTGHTRSCGCDKKHSQWEDLIANFLSQHHIQFIPEYRFFDCRNLQGTDTLPFDFYLTDLRMLIEYDGIHHYYPVSTWGGEEKFLITQRNDNIKNMYCEEHNIPLLRIPYTYTKEEVIQAIDCFIQPVTTTA